MAMFVRLMNHYDFRRTTRRWEGRRKSRKFWLIVGLGGEMRVSIGQFVGVTSRATTLAVLVVVALAAFGCARKPAVSAEGLSLRRVVVYRNGVGYLERAGHIQADKVFFKVKGSEVGDFLATLAVIEK